VTKTAHEPKRLRPKRPINSASETAHDKFQNGPQMSKMTHGLKVSINHDTAYIIRLGLWITDKMSRDKMLLKLNVTFIFTKVTLDIMSQ